MQCLLLPVSSARLLRPLRGRRAPVVLLCSSSPTFELRPEARLPPHNTILMPGPPAPPRTGLLSLSRDHLRHHHVPRASPPLWPTLPDVQPPIHCESPLRQPSRQMPQNSAFRCRFVLVQPSVASSATNINPRLPFWVAGALALAPLNVSTGPLRSLYPNLLPKDHRPAAPPPGTSAPTPPRFHPRASPPGTPHDRQSVRLLLPSSATIARQYPS